jgi:hypothetical protein
MCLRVAGVIDFLPDGSHTSSGNNSNRFSYIDAAGNSFNRNVTAVLNNIVQDDISGSLANNPQVLHGNSAPFSASDPVAARGPGGRRITPGLISL